VDTWAFKHPKPEDFFNWFETAAGRDLGWFWRSWYFEQWMLDHAISGVETSGSETRITVEDLGELPMPARVAVEREDGSIEHVEVPVDTWLEGARSAVLTVSSSPAVTRVTLDPEQRSPDRDRSNDMWRAGAGND